MKADKIVLGEKYTEVIHGRTGIATALCNYLTGCTQVCLEWLDNDGKIDEAWVDITRLTEVTLPKKEREPGGPQKHPPRK